MRAVLPRDKQEQALEALRRENLRLVSVTPVRRSLEDYFVAQLKPATASAPAPGSEGITGSGDSLVARQADRNS